MCRTRLGRRAQRNRLIQQRVQLAAAIVSFVCEAIKFVAAWVRKAVLMQAWVCLHMPNKRIDSTSPVAGYYVSRGARVVRNDVCAIRVDYFRRSSARDFTLLGRTTT